MQYLQVISMPFKTKLLLPFLNSDAMYSAIILMDLGSGEHSDNTKWSVFVS